MSNAFSMFKSATIMLTIWYSSILIFISILFSLVIFSIATSEVGTRINTLQKIMPELRGELQTDYIIVRNTQVREAQDNLTTSLVMTNVGIWIAGSIGSYYLARRTLRPIEEVHEAQSRFTSDASHELRTPLASMKIELEVALRDKNITKAEQRDLLESNLEEVNKLTKLSHTLLQLSRLDHDNIVREKVELTAVAASVIDRFDKTGERIHLATTRPVYVLANESNVEELLTIMVDNAVKYSPSDSTVEVSVIKQRQQAGFKVVNQGEGIAADVLPHIFDRFYRADSSRTSTNDGKSYGLGLSLAKKIVELHKGELTVSSAPGADTTFIALLPLRGKDAS